MPAGTYTLYTIPSEQAGWTLIVNTSRQASGAPSTTRPRDLGRVKMSEGVMPSSPVETFLPDPGSSGRKDLSSEMHLVWETTDVTTWAWRLFP